MADELVAVRGVADERLEFFGGPGTMVATVGLRNVSGDRVRLRRTVPRVCSDLSGTGEPLRAHPARRAVLDPSAEDSVLVRLRLPMHTAPGDYNVEVNVGGTVQSAVLHVLEAVAVNLTPDVLLISGTPTTQQRRIAITNEGNVPVTVGSLVVPLDDEVLECRSLRAAAREFSETGVRFDDFLSAVVRQGHNALERAGLLRVRSADGETVVEPGTTALVTLELQVPDTLDRNTRYTAIVPIATEDLQVTVEPGWTPVATPGDAVRPSPKKAAAKKRPPKAT